MLLQCFYGEVAHDKSVMLRVSRQLQVATFPSHFPISARLPRFEIKTDDRPGRSRASNLMSNSTISLSAVMQTHTGPCQQGSYEIQRTFTEILCSKMHRGRGMFRNIGAKDFDRFEGKPSILLLGVKSLHSGTTEVAKQ